MGFTMLVRLGMRAIMGSCNIQFMLPKIIRLRISKQPAHELQTAPQQLCKSNLHHMGSYTQGHTESEIHPCK